MNKFESEYGLYSYLNACGYGMVVNNTVVPITNSTTVEQLQHYRTISPKDFEKYRIGVCWDYCAYEEYIFKAQLKIPYTCYYIETAPPASDTHSFLIFRKNGKFYKIESSFLSFRGIEAFDNEKDILKLYTNKVSKGRPYVMFKFNQPTVFNQTSKEYMDNMWVGKNFIMSNVSDYQIKKIFGIDMNSI